MAHVVPYDFLSIDYAPKQMGEIRTLERLQKELPNDYTVFHSLHWAVEERKYTKWGEIDFVIVNRAGEILFIEQKGGELDEGPDGLTKTYGAGKPKSVVDQVHRNHENIREKMKRSLTLNQYPHVDYLVYLPDYRVRNVNAAGIGRNRIIDLGTKDQLANRVQKRLGPGNEAGKDPDPKFVRTVLGFFNQEFEVVPAVSTHIDKQTKLFTRLRQGLTAVVENLDFSPFRLRIDGEAGCGKSQVTLSQFTRWNDAGKRTLLVCFNHALGQNLSVALDDHPEVGTFHDFCVKAARKAGQPVDMDKVYEDGFWSDVLDRVIELDVQAEDKYDALIVDEGQDFEKGWFERLELFLKPGADILWLEDQGQNLVGKPRLELPDFVTFREYSNFRSPQSIGRFIKESLGKEFKVRNPLPGLGVDIHVYKEEAAQLGLLEERISALLDQGFEKDQIVLVSCRGVRASPLMKCETIGDYKLKHFTKSYDRLGRQLHSEGDIFADTIFRFKGQQAPAVIVTDIHPGMKIDDWSKRILYCAMTRASVRLELMVDQQSEWAKLLLKAQDEGTGAENKR